MKVIPDQLFDGLDIDQISLSYEWQDDLLVRRASLYELSHETWIRPASIRDSSPSITSEAVGDWDRLALRGAAIHSDESNLKGMELRYVDLFAGCGGLSLGIEQAAEACGVDARSVMAVDLDRDILKIYERNIRTDMTISDDVRSSSLPEPDRLGQIDLLIGGPPCQGHSNLNNHSRRDDHRNGLYREMANFAVRYDIPQVIIENVPSVVRSYDGVVDDTRDIFRQNGYTVATTIINASHIGVPQTRKRHFMLASKYQNIDIDQIIRSCATEQRSVKWSISDLLGKESSTSFDTPANISDENRYRIRKMFDRGDYDMPNELRPLCHRNGHTYKSVYGRLDWNKLAGTITTGFLTPGRGRFIHPLRQRTLTFHEAARLQTFPDTFKFELPGVRETRRTLETAIGNAVPPKLGFVIGLWGLSGFIQSEKWSLH